MKKNTVKIISGEYRGRNIQFLEIDGLRPTANRIRETLFNWLQNELVGKTCLDLFAGSGALGIEALSRGAESVTFVEKDRQMAKQIQNNLQALKINHAEVINASYQSVLTRPKHYDIIFLDPPYQLNLLPKLLEEIALFSPRYLYIENSKPLDELLAGVQWKSLKHKKAGGVYYALGELD